MPMARRALGKPGASESIRRQPRAEAARLPADRGKRKELRRAAARGDLERVSAVIRESQGVDDGIEFTEEGCCASVSFRTPDGAACKMVQAENGKGSPIARTLRALARPLSDVQVGEPCVVGRTLPLAGLYRGQTYEVRRLFYRQIGASLRGGEVDVRSSAEMPPEGVGSELHAELFCQKRTPWGSVEMSVRDANLRSVQAELRRSLTAAIGASTFWLLMLPALLNWRLVYVPSGSMEPTIKTGDVVAVRKLPGEAIRRGDIIAFRPPQSLRSFAMREGQRIPPSQLFVKRVEGLPGDVLRADSGSLSRNGATLPGGCSSGRQCVTPTYDFSELRVEPGSLAVFGDNRGASTDSHLWGLVPQEKVFGKAVWRLLPLPRAGPLY